MLAKVLKGRNVSDLLIKGVSFLDEYGTTNDSRDGRVKEVAWPVTSVYLKPKERVLFFPERDANPFFHLMEALWMLNGNRDVKWISRFNSRIHTFSDNGEYFHGAYGYRWRSFFKHDQFDRIINELKANNLSRRVVLQMWSAPDDLGGKGKDVPCNVAGFFWIRDGKLNLTICNRSNDIIWGAYGANAVHMSLLQEYIAGMVGVEVGAYCQISNNFHAYLDKGVWGPCLDLAKLFQGGGYTDPYKSGEVTPYALFKGVDNLDIRQRFLPDLRYWMDDPLVYDSLFPFFREVATPMYQAWFLYKERELRAAEALLQTQCEAGDWRKAGVEWIQRRINKQG